MRPPLGDDGSMKQHVKMFSITKTSARNGRIILLTACLLVAVSFLYLSRSFVTDTFHKVTTKLSAPEEPTTPKRQQLRIQPQKKKGGSLAQAKACRGPRGGLLSDALSDDLPRPLFDLPNTTYPEETWGSYDALGIEKSWMTIDQRYGPYGYGEDEEGYNFTKADWSTVDWGKLQDECYATNREGFNRHATPLVGAAPRFRFVNEGLVLEPPRYKTGRQAIVLRAWSKMKYKPEDLWNIRSIVTEANLATGGEYTIFLLVDVKGEKGVGIHHDDAKYREVLEEVVPKEFRSMAVLFHSSLQSNWYAKVNEVRLIWQVMQPLQLFAHFYPEFDHYWQFEMDSRFTGHVGKMLQAFHDFGSKEPIKQARERSSWTHMPRIHGTYEDLTMKVNRTLQGGATVWGPVKIKNFEPIGPEPPVADPKAEDFTWGVGQEADLLIMGPLNHVNRFEREADWVFKYWYHGGFEEGIDRFMSVPAQARGSWDLLEATHRAQHELGLKVPSEATLPSFAMWHGLKLVGLPIPKFQSPERDIRELSFVQNGGLPGDFKDGIANGPAVYRSSTTSFFTNRKTMEWEGPLGDVIFNSWMGRVPVEEMPHFMREVQGRRYVPSLVMHPRKTNK